MVRAPVQDVSGREAVALDLLLKILRDPRIPGPLLVVFFFVSTSLNVPPDSKS
jgi:hypothetical protein